MTLVPRPDPGAVAGRLAPLLIQRLVTAVAGAALTDRLGPGWTLGPLTQLLVHPGQVLAPLLDGDRVGAVLEALSALIGAPPTSGQVALPGGLVLRAAGRPGRVSLRTEPPFAVPGVAGGPPGTVELELDVDLATPGAGVAGVAGGLTLDVPLGGTWGGVKVALGFDHATVSLTITPRTAAGPPLEPIVLLPLFGGLGPLAADAVQALLPALLDALVARLPDPRSALASAVLAVADAAGIHGGSGDSSFAAHHPSFAAHHPSLAAHHPSLAAHHPSFAAHHPTFAAHHPTFAAHHPSLGGT